MRCKKHKAFIFYFWKATCAALSSGIVVFVSLFLAQAWRRDK